MLLKYIVRKVVLKLLKDKRASPLIEEGMLIGLSVITLTILLSIITGILGGLKSAYVGAESSFNNIIEQIIGELNKLWEYVTSILSGG
ncbi:MAG: hypothetical protein DRN15_06995 [Thermoprotei archaeon]|nr:MAG: hypothetical protein DRM97_07760 [Thermoprotei archaeon]RLF23195.1 MAG: hypothetical protein DRN15_06995 [Thermoprotei archaeon]